MICVLGALVFYICGYFWCRESHTALLSSKALYAPYWPSVVFDESKPIDRFLQQFYSPLLWLDHRYERRRYELKTRRTFMGAGDIIIDTPTNEVKQINENARP